VNFAVFFNYLKLPWGNILLSSYCTSFIILLSYYLVRLLFMASNLSIAITESVVVYDTFCTSVNLFLDSLYSICNATGVNRKSVCANWIVIFRKYEEKEKLRSASFSANGKFSWCAWPVRLDKPLYSSGSRTWYEYLASTHDAIRAAKSFVLKVYRSNSMISVSH